MHQPVAIAIEAESTQFYIFCFFFFLLIIIMRLRDGLFEWANGRRKTFSWVLRGSICIQSHVILIHQLIFIHNLLTMIIQNVVFLLSNRWSCMWTNEYLVYNRVKLDSNEFRIVTMVSECFLIAYDYSNDVFTKKKIQKTNYQYFSQCALLLLLVINCR